MELNKPTKRAFYSKTRTGCLTCKTRKVKCGEEKPHCNRCVSTGRTCDGYRPPGSRSRHASSQPAAGGAAAASPSPGTIASQSGLFASASERRSFYYFHTHASKPLAGYFHLSFWGREVMQAAIHYEPIRHLVIAVGAAYESLEDGEPAGLSQDSGGGMEFALQQCNHAIRQLATISSSRAASDYKSTESTCCILTASVLFIYLASIRGHIAEAIQHVRSAVKVLRDFEQSQSPETRQKSPANSPVFPVPVSQLRAILTSAYGHLRAMSDDVAREDFQSGTRDMLSSSIKPATVFLSVPEANAYVEKLFQNTLAFNQRMELQGRPAPTDTEGLEAVVARHRELCQALDSSWNALDVLAESLGSSPGGPTDWDQEADREGIMVLRTYHLLLAVRLRIDVFRPDQRESAFDDLEAHLEEMLQYCEILVANRERRGEDPRRRQVSSGLGYVMPLHMIAARCRNPKLRRRALHLLLTASRREGIWDSYLAGTIASQTLEIEEQGSRSANGGDERVLDGDMRVREVKIKLQGEKKALLRFVTVADWKNGGTGTEKIIEW